MIDNIWLVAIGVVLGIVVALTLAAPVIALQGGGADRGWSSPSVDALQTSATGSDVVPVKYGDDVSRLSTGLALDVGLSTVISAGPWDSAAFARLSFWVTFTSPVEDSSCQGEG